MQANLITSALDALSMPVAILNDVGVIVYVNRGWREFADINAFTMMNYGVGANYLEFCYIEPEGSRDSKTSPIAQGIRDVIAGKRETYTQEYACHSPIEERWFQMRVSAFDHEGSRYAMVMHENVTLNRAAENRLRNILENAPIGMAIVSLGGRFLECNQALEQILGYERNELLALTCNQISHPDDLDVGEAMLQDIINKKHGAFRIEKRLVHKNGSTIWINLTCSVLFNDIGAPIQVIKQIQDISEKTRSETLLRDSEHRLNMVLNHMPALIGYWNKDLVNEFGNKAYLDWFGVDPEHIKGMHILEVIGETLYALNQSYIEKVLMGEAQLFERTIIDKLGMEHYSLASYIPDVSEQQVKGFFVLVTDITQIKLTELQLRRSEELSQIVLRVAIDGYIFSDLTGKFVDVSTSFCDMLGYSKAEILNMSVIDIEANEKNEQIDAHFIDIVTKGFDRFETQHRRKDGMLIDVEVSVAYLSDKKQLFAFIRDISERKQAEMRRITKLEQQRDVLIREVHHRIKNHLQGVVGFLSLYSNNERDNCNYIKDIAAKISSIALVYGIQGNNNPDGVFLCKITHEICHSLAFFGLNKHRINFSVENNHKALLTSDYAVPIAIIINELIVNAIKHNADFPIQNVDVNLSINQTNAVLTITNKSLVNSEFPNLEQNFGLGLGLSLVLGMLPTPGASISLTQHRGVVRTTFIVEEPIISIQSK